MSKRFIFAVKTVLGCIFMIIVLGTSVLSKLTLVSLTDKLRNVTYYPNSTKRAAADNEVDFDTAVTLYWYLQFVLLIPNLITFVRCLAFGVIGKTTTTYPWPKGRNILLVSFTKLSSNILVSLWVQCTLFQLQYTNHMHVVVRTSWLECKYMCVLQVYNCS